MILHRLALRRFLGLPDHTFEFAPGLNVVVGPNEAGKSTLRVAIRTALYENPATTSSELREKFRTWGFPDPPELTLELELAGTRFRLTKSFAARKVELVELATGRSWDQHRLVQERLVEVLGLASDKVFDATAHIAQAELERIHLNSIAKELGRIIGGGGEDVTAALRRLEAHIRALERGTRGLAKEPGMLAALEQQGRALRDEVDALRRNVVDADRARTQLAEADARLAELRISLETKDTLLAQNRLIIEDEERLSTLRREEAMWEQRVRQIEDLTSRLAELSRELERATASGVPDEEATRDARRLHDRIADCRHRLDALQVEADRPERSAPTDRGRVIVLAGGLLVAAGGAAAWAIGPLGWILVVLGIAAGVAGVRSSVRAAADEQRALARREERMRRRRELEAEGAEASAALNARLSRLGVASVAEAEAAFRRYRDLVQEQAQLNSFLARLREGTDDEAITERWTTARRDVFGLQERLRGPDVQARRLTPLQLQALEQEVRDLRGQVDQLQMSAMRLTVAVERLATDGEVLAAKSELLQEAEDRLARARRHHQVCREALSGLQRARELAQIPLRAVVESKAGEYLAAATDRRYTRIQMEPESLELSVWSPDAGEWKSAAEPHLSRGTIDLVYLAVRLALVGVLTNGRRPPLLFDDPFITFDDGRREGALALLRSLSAEYQVFLFTCTRHYDRLADRLISLPDRAALVRTPDVPPPAALVPTVQAEPEPEPAEPAVGPLWEQRPD